MKSLLLLLLSALPLLAAEFAKVENGQLIQVRKVPDSVDYATTFDTTLWKPVVRNAQPVFDDATQKLVQTITINADNVTFGWSVEALTQAELDAKAAAAEREVERQEIASTLATVRAKLKDGSITDVQIRKVLLYLLRNE